MSAQHSSGPWTACLDQHATGRGPNDVQHDYWVQGPWRNGCRDVANIRFTHAGDEATAEANTRIMAAAPDLLEALVELLAAPDMHRPARVWDEARAAIAKATGA